MCSTNKLIVLFFFFSSLYADANVSYEAIRTVVQEKKWTSLQKMVEAVIPSKHLFNFRKKKEVKPPDVHALFEDKEESVLILAAQQGIPLAMLESLLLKIGSETLHKMAILSKEVEKLWEGSVSDRRYADIFMKSGVRCYQYGVNQTSRKISELIPESGVIDPSSENLYKHLLINYVYDVVCEAILQSDYSFPTRLETENWLNENRLINCFISYSFFYKPAISVGYNLFVQESLAYELFSSFFQPMVGRYSIELPLQYGEVQEKTWCLACTPQAPLLADFLERACKDAKEPLSASSFDREFLDSTGVYKTKLCKIIYISLFVRSLQEARKFASSLLPEEKKELYKAINIQVYLSPSLEKYKREMIFQLSQLALSGPQERLLLFKPSYLLRIIGGILLGCCPYYFVLTYVLSKNSKVEDFLEQVMGYGYKKRALSHLVFLSALSAMCFLSRGKALEIENYV